MELYYKPGACSLASHIALRETGADFDLVRVDTATGRTEDGRDYAALNPKGYVPALRLADGRVLTEGAAILQFVADRSPAAGLAPAGGFERARLQEHLNFIASELHKAFTPFFSGADLDGPAREAALVRLRAKLSHAEAALADGRDHLLGEGFTVADAYLFVVAGWSAHIGLPLDEFPRLAAFLARVADRQSVRAALRAEGLAA